MTKKDILRQFAYTEWANHSVLDVAESLSADELHYEFHTGQHSIFETLVHMLGAEWIWLERWEGNKYRTLPNLEGPFKSAGASLTEVRKGWNEIEKNRAAFLEGLSEEAIQAHVAYKNVAGDSFSQPLIDQMQHVVNHATHHRGQVVGFFRALGFKPPTTDMIHYFRTVA